MRCQLVCSVVLAVWLPLLTSVTLCGDGVESWVAEEYDARDSLNSVDATGDAEVCLSGLCWQPTTFSVAVEGTANQGFDELVRFESPVPSGDAQNDMVTMAWYLARNGSGLPVKAPAVVVVHESGSQMPAGRLFARGLKQKGLHAFLIRLPYYGERRGVNPSRPDLLTTLRQGVADVRRARDAVAVLPYVNEQNVSVQGTSLGGFVAALAASLDGAYDHAFITLAGGNLFELLSNGQGDADKLRRDMMRTGISEEELKEILWQVEPTRIAHRLNASSTWLYSARDDQIVPAKYSHALAGAAGLDPLHHIVFPGNHYSVFIYFPRLLDEIAAHVRQ